VDLLAIWVLALVPALAAPLLGYWALGVSAVLLVLVWRIGAHPSGRPLAVVAVASGLFGGLIGAASAALALTAVDGDPAYAARLLYGYLALGLALVAAVGGLLAALYPRLAALLLLFGALAGTAAISLFYIDTPYLLAAMLMLVAAVLTLLSRSAESRSNE
jgi:hypothetical protein